MGIVANPYKTTGLLGWIDNRFPLTKLWRSQVAEYYAPKNFNLWYYFGSLALLVLVNQIVTGIFLTMHYQPGAETAFDSVQSIMRDVSWGWLIRYMHAMGASAFFVVIYLHMFRGIIYGSHQKPRELVWVFGCFIFLCLMAEAFCGYVLPWGNMSYWGAKVILSLFGAIPWVGESLQVWIQGDYTPAGATLNRLFSFHVIALPLVLLLLVVMHLMALHEVGSNNPDGVEIHDHNDENGVPLDGVPFHPYYTVKDLVGVCVFLLIFFGLILLAPEGGGLVLEPDNMTPANPMVTPAEIHPAWYFGVFYAMLRSVPAVFDTQVWGVIVMFGAVIVLFFLPWLDRSGVRSIRYKGRLFKTAIVIFTLDVLVLEYFGMQEVNPLFTLITRVATVIYFAFFLLMPFYSKWDKTKPVPQRVTE